MTSLVLLYAIVSSAVSCMLQMWTVFMDTWWQLGFCICVGNICAKSVRLKYCESTLLSNFPAFGSQLRIWFRNAKNHKNTLMKLACRRTFRMHGGF